MRICKANKHTEKTGTAFDLGKLVHMALAISISHGKKPKYRDEFYMNENGQIVWDTYVYDFSTTVPASTIVYNVVKE